MQVCALGLDYEIRTCRMMGLFSVLAKFQYRKSQTNTELVDFSIVVY